jgi:hypothetical protein
MPRPEARLHCKHAGCPVYYSAGGEHAMRRHEAEPHVVCTCGRHFTNAGLAQHLSKVRKFNKPHPPLVNGKKEGRREFRASTPGGLVGILERLKGPGRKLRGRIEITNSGYVVAVINLGQYKKP